MKNTLAILVFILSTCISSAQVSSKHSVRTSIGFNGIEGTSEDGIGYSFSFGFQQSLLKSQRLRLHQDLVFSWYSNEGIEDAPDKFFTTQMLYLTASYDIIKLKSFSFFLNFGTFGCHSRGLIGTGGDVAVPNQSSRYFRGFYLGMEASGGFRWASPDKGYGIYFNPIFLGKGTSEMLMAGTFVGVEFKLK